MLQIVGAVAFILFGLFLKNTKNQEFQRSRKYSKFFIILGVLTLIGGIILKYLKSQ
jgi:uncharacterized membrane protein